VPNCHTLESAGRGALDAGGFGVAHGLWIGDHRFVGQEIATPAIVGLQVRRVQTQMRRDERGETRGHVSPQFDAPALTNKRSERRRG
jgi:hypothetical protein